jgi:hypothetical protein
MKEIFEVNPGNDGNWLQATTAAQFDTKVLGTNEQKTLPMIPSTVPVSLRWAQLRSVGGSPRPERPLRRCAPAGDDQASHWDTSSRASMTPEGITVNLTPARFTSRAMVQPK